MRRQLNSILTIITKTKKNKTQRRLPGKNKENPGSLLSSFFS